MRYLEQWCDMAVSYIRFPPDRPAVKQELLEHMQDKYDGYVADGMPPSEAESRAVREMGQARETGELLRRIHKPYLGWLWRCTQWAVGICLILAVVNAGRWFSGLHISEDPYFLGDGNQYEIIREESYIEYSDSDVVTERVLYLEPNCLDSSDGYTFTVTRAVCLKDTTTSQGETRESYSFYFLLEVTNPRPWAGYTEAPRWFYAVDSLGNYYYSLFEADRDKDPAIVGNASRTGLFTWTFDMWAEEYCSQDADWLELRYDRDGRDVKLRIDLTGGEGA